MMWREERSGNDVNTAFSYEILKKFPIKINALILKHSELLTLVLTSVSIL